jgi:hypothetical protein
MDARSADSTPTYSNSEYNGGLQGAVVWLDYDAKDVASGPVSVEVVTPAGQHVVASFDLSKLR